MSTVRRPHQRAVWRWPIAVEMYDRSPGLSDEERTALTQLLQRLEGYRVWPVPLAPALERLFSPVTDALALTRAHSGYRFGVLYVVATESLRRGLSLWGWTSDQWAETFGADYKSFRAQHGVQEGSRQHLLLVAYLLTGWFQWRLFRRLELEPMARKVFGDQQIDAALGTVLEPLKGWGYRPVTLKVVRRALCDVLLSTRSPHLEDLTAERLAELWVPSEQRHSGYVALSRVLYGLGLIERSIEVVPSRRDRLPPSMGYGASPEWMRWCRRWWETSTLLGGTRDSHYLQLLKTGRWLAAVHPEVTSPAQWTAELAGEFVAMVSRLTVGQWAVPNIRFADRVGQPMTPHAKSNQLGTVRVFFINCIEWGWFTRRFDPRRLLRTPNSLRALMGPKPRTIADDIWAKLVWAGLNLTQDDVTPTVFPGGSWYPLEFVRAVAAVWLFAGLRSDEVRRLRVGCVRWQAASPNEGDPSAERALCLLEVPVNKTGPAFTKPVDRIVGDAILAWEAVRPEQPSLTERKTGEVVQYLFTFRGRQLGTLYLNETLIPILCRKAGVPESDARGTITSHRARATIATQLYNAKEPLTLFELQAWLGHRSPASTQHYAKLTPTKLARAYADADYFARNVRTITVLLDQDAVRQGATARGEAWKLYDLGHGYCSYDFFDQCPHRMACAKCAFYVPKGSSRAQAVEGKANLLHMLQEIPLTGDERAAVEDGVAAFDRLLESLADVRAPDGATPRQLERDRERRPESFG